MSKLYPVLFLRWVGRNEEGQYYAKKAILPLPPSVGIGVIIDPDSDYDKITNVFVNNDGDIVCMFSEKQYDTVDCDSDDWPAQLAYHVQGWIAIGQHNCCYHTPKQLIKREARERNARCQR